MRGSGVEVLKPNGVIKLAVILLKPFYATKAFERLLRRNQCNPGRPWTFPSHHMSHTPFSEMTAKVAQGSLGRAKRIYRYY